jgi:hypothetical protein
MAFAPLGALGCGGASWDIRRELAPFSMPRHVSIMVFRSRAVRKIDRDGYVDLVAGRLQQDLASTGRTSEIVPLAGAPRLPRIELAFYILDVSEQSTQVYGERVGSAAITFDCAFVSSTDQVAFVGRVSARDGEGNLSLAAEAAADEVAKVLTRG